MRWPDLIPLERREVMPFPVSGLPSVLRNYAEELAESYQVPIDLPASLMLGVVATVLAKNFVIQAGADWVEPCNLFVAVAQPPGSRKSAIFKEIARPLEQIEREYIEKNAGDGQGQTTCSPSRLIVDDVSPEQLASLMAQNDGRIAVFSSEGGIFDTMAGRYSKGTPNLDVFLKGHAGDALRVDRVNRGSDFIESAALTVCLTFQPDVLQDIAAKPGFRARGLLGRFLYSLPPSLLGRRKIQPPPVGPGTRAAYDLAIHMLHSRRPPGFQ